MELPDSLLASGRVLIADSVFEDASLTIRDGSLYIEFDADDLENVTVDLAALSRIEREEDA